MCCNILPGSSCSLFSYQYNSYGQSTARQSIIFEIIQFIKVCGYFSCGALPLAVVWVSPRSELTLNLVEPPFDATALILLLSSSYKVCCCPFGTSSPRSCWLCVRILSVQNVIQIFLQKLSVIHSTVFVRNCSLCKDFFTSESASFEPSLSEMLSSVSDANSALSAVSCCTSNSMHHLN